MEVAIVSDLIMSGALAHIDNVHVDWPLFTLSDKVAAGCILLIRLYWKRVITQYRGWTVVFQICTMYTAFLDKEIFHQSPGRRSR